MGFEDDFAAGEVFELADEVALPTLSVDLRFVVPGSRVVVAGIRVGE